MWKKTVLRGGGMGFVFSMIFCMAVGSTWAELPVKDPKGDWGDPYPGTMVRNPVSFRNITNIVGTYGDAPGQEGFILNLGDEACRGTIYVGPYPFEKAPQGTDNDGGGADYDYMRFRISGDLENGKGEIPVYRLFADKYNANSWKPGEDVKTVAYRIDLNRDDVHLGFYQSRLSFVAKGSGYKNLTLEKRVTIVQGPYMALKRSDDPSRVRIMWETDETHGGEVFIAGPLGDQGGFRSAGASDRGRRHEVEVSGLLPDAVYEYYVQCGPTQSPVYRFRTAPHRKDRRSEVTLAFCSDSREGKGGGERNYMGHNLLMLRRIAMDAYRRGAQAFLFGGDLVNGYTSSTEDFELQLKGWKQALAGFWRTRPVYPAMGNHETLLNIYQTGTNEYYGGLALDKWSGKRNAENHYETESAEAIFAREFVNPVNGPTPADDRRPTYKENVYEFQYGPVLCIAFNNNYWWTTNAAIGPHVNQNGYLIPAWKSDGEVLEGYGGSPEGYIMNDQMEWIEKALEEAEQDTTVKYVLLYAQEPVFPCGGHIKDAMWWNGDNHYRAYTYYPDPANPELRPAPEGMIEVRNRFWKAVANCPKVAAVLAGDEHEYHRVLITKETPVGVVAKDDTDGDGILEQYSANGAFTYPTYQLTAGTGGAPYYAREETPWKPQVFSSQPGYILFEADERGISAAFFTFTGQMADYVENLMDVKQSGK